MSEKEHIAVEETPEETFLRLVGITWQGPTWRAPGEILYSLFKIDRKAGDAKKQLQQILFQIEKVYHKQEDIGFRRTPGGFAFGRSERNRTLLVKLKAEIGEGFKGRDLDTQWLSMMLLTLVDILLSE